MPPVRDPSRRRASARRVWPAALGVALLGAPGCAALAAQGRRNAIAECASLRQCVVYDDTGRHLSPCWTPPGRFGTIYPGDPQWPFEPGVCPPAVAAASDAKLLHSE